MPMTISEGHVGMVVLFGRNRGEQTRGEIIKVNRKKFKVKTLESRGTKRSYPVGSVWVVPPSLCEKVEDAPSAPVNRSAPTPRTTTRTRRTTGSVDVSERRAVRAAADFTANFEAGCSLASPPTYISKSRHYLDGKSLDKWDREYDSRRQKLYDAENKVTRGIEFADIKEAQKYLDKLYDSAWFQRRFSTTRKPELVETWGGGSNYGYNGLHKIRLSGRNHMCERILIHELVHAIVRKPHAGHGRLYAAVYLDLVRHCMGEEVYTKLRDEFRNHNVKYTPHQKVLR